MDEDNDVDEVEFSDDELETAWRRQQRAAEPSKRKMPQSGPASAMHNGAPAARVFLLFACLAGGQMLTC